MSMTETAKQLAAQKNMESRHGLTYEALQVEKEVFQGQVFTEISRQFAPLSEAIALQSRDFRQSMGEFKHMTKLFHEEFQGAIQRATQAGAELKERSGRITTKLWVVLMVASLSTGALSAYGCLRMLPNLSGDREAATYWRTFQSQFQKLTPAQQNTVQQYLFSNPKR
jgi:hypothetical protein